MNIDFLNLIDLKLGIAKVQPDSHGLKMHIPHHEPLHQSQRCQVQARKHIGLIIHTEVNWCTAWTIVNWLLTGEGSKTGFC